MIFCIREMKHKIKWMVTIVLVLLGTQMVLSQENPNIILIYADDIGYGDIGCYGGEAIPTPNINKLAEEGMRFTAGYATASTCTPSRYSILTGQYPFRNYRAKQEKVLPGNAPLIIDPAQPTLPAMLKDVGYTTGLVGKWHLGLGSPKNPLDWNTFITPGPNEVGFDYSYHMAATNDRVPSVYIKNGYIENLDSNDPVQVSYKKPIGNDPTGLSHPELLKTQTNPQHSGTIVNGVGRIGWMSGGKSARWKDENMGDIYLNKVVNFIEKNKKKPFFLFYSSHENHVPRIPHPRFKGATSLGVRGDVVVQLDWNVGQIVKSLKENGLYENTIIVFTSDNGPAVYDGYYDGAYEKNGDHQPTGPYRGGKYSAWEGGCRVPFIVSGPNNIQKGVSDAIISQADLLASFADLTGGKISDDFEIDSQNLINLLTGKSNKGREHVVLQGVGIKSIRKGAWKYIPPGKVRSKGSIDEMIFDYIGNEGALFFLPEDPSETNNLASKYPQKAKELSLLLNAELSEK